MVNGLRPTKPENASSIGFSDSLWSFAQRCWDGDMKLRPKVTEVVTCLDQVAADWDGLMPPCRPAEKVASRSEPLTSDTMNHREFTILILPRYCSLNAGTEGIFQSRSTVVPESPTESQATSGLFSRSSETPREEPQPIANSPSVDPQPEPQAPTQPQPMPWAPSRLRSEEPHNDLHLPDMYAHPYGSPPSRLPVKKRKGLKRYVNLKLPESLKRPGTPPARPAEGVRAGHPTAVSQVEGDPMGRRELEMFTAL